MFWELLFSIASALMPYFLRNYI